jgi:holo-[acyl-carrier protein] synthase
MIQAVGIDIVDTGRIRRAYEAYGEKFLRRFCSPGEIAVITASPGEAISKIAGRFAAKEAVMKALGQFFDRGVFLRDIEILDDSGQISVRLPQRLHSGLRGKRIMISISGPETIALAMAMISDEA